MAFLRKKAYMNKGMGVRLNVTKTLISYKDCAVCTLTNIYIWEYDKNVKVSCIRQ